MDITARFAALAIDAVRRVAAEEILPRYRRSSVLHKDDGGIITEADLAAQDALGTRLRAVHDVVPMLGEEMDMEGARPLFGVVHDPIAAPRRYWRNGARGSGTRWSVIQALLSSSCTPR